MTRFSLPLLLLAGCLPDAQDDPNWTCEDQEIPYDGLDNDCDPGTPDDDLDGDGFLAATDCDDDNAAIHPDADEVCDAANVDENCNDLANDDDPTVTDARDWFRDEDDDDFGSPDDQLTACDRPSGYTEDSGDCDDTEASVNPDADEICDGFGWDDDCDGLTDTDDPDLTGDLLTLWLDTDGDGYGIDGMTNITACSVPDGYAVAGEEDCGPGDGAINPGMDELCDGANVDENCDGSANDASAIDAVEYFQDSDGDGYGAAGASQRSCTPVPNASTTSDDCDDGNDLIHPDQVERCDSIDWNCDMVDAEPGLVTAIAGLSSTPLDVSTTPGTSTDINLATSLSSAEEIVFCGDSTYYVNIHTDRTIDITGLPLQGQLPALDGSDLQTVITVEGSSTQTTTVKLQSVIIQNGQGTNSIGFGPWSLDDSGGGVFCDAYAGLILGVPSAETIVQVVDSVVQDNEAQGGGGGIAARGCEVVLTRTDVLNNRATSGGGLYADSSSVLLYSTTFQENAGLGIGMATSRTQAQGGGGAHLNFSSLLCTPASRTTVASRFVENTTLLDYGSAVVLDWGSVLEAQGCDFGETSSGTDNPGFDIAGVNICYDSSASCDDNRDVEGWNLYEYGDGVTDMQCVGRSWTALTFLQPYYGAESQQGVNCEIIF